MPAVGRALVTLNRKYRQAIEQGAALSARMGEDRQAVMATLPSTPFEEVRDFFYLHHNYIEELDEAAEAIAVRMQFPVGQMAPALSAYLENHHGVKSYPIPPMKPDRFSGFMTPQQKHFVLRRTCGPDSTTSSCWASGSASGLRPFAMA